MKERGFCAMGIAVLALAAGCGGESSGSSCGGGGACGGDVVGTWSIENACVDASAIIGKALDQPACKDAMNVKNLDVSGSYQFSADGTMKTAVVMNMTIGMVLKSACLQALGTSTAPSTEFCNQFAASMNQTIKSDPTSPLASVSCSLSGSACDCNVEAATKTLQNAGPYSVNGTSLVEANGDTSGYCVSGDTLRLFPPATADINGTIVLKRQ